MADNEDAHVEPVEVKLTQKEEKECESYLYMIAESID